MTTDNKTYQHFDAATRGIDAYAVIYKGSCVGRVIFKHGDSCRCFAQVWNVAMGEGSARGHGFDRPTEAFETAIFKIKPDAKDDPQYVEHVRKWQALFPRNASDSGEHWDNRLKGAGYIVQHVV